MADQNDNAAPALKEIFNAERIHHIASEVKAIFPHFDEKNFLSASLQGLDALSLMARLRRVTECLHATLPEDYRTGLGILRELAPRLNHGFVTMILSDYVALYGLDDFEASIDALRFFTTFGSSEFAVRHFLRLDLHRTLAVMEDWSLDEDEHVRRLASEGSRPRLPWSFRITPLMTDPSPIVPILNNLKSDPSLYVRKSVANSLNDITKDNPDIALELIESWPLDDARTMWIAKHALRSLIKKGDRRALAVIGAGETAEVSLTEFCVSPAAIKLGGRIVLSFRLQSTSAKPQRLVVDYAIHYVKKNGATSAKVFKLKTLTLGPYASESVKREQLIRDFTTRVHYMGRHEVEILVNGESLGRASFDLIE